MIWALLCPYDITNKRYIECGSLIPDRKALFAFDHVDVSSYENVSFFPSAELGLGANGINAWIQLDIDPEELEPGLSYDAGILYSPIDGGDNRAAVATWISRSIVTKWLGGQGSSYTHVGYWGYHYGNQVLPDGGVNRSKTGDFLLIKWCDHNEVPGRENSLPLSMARTIYKTIVQKFTSAPESGESEDPTVRSTTPTTSSVVGTRTRPKPMERRATTSSSSSSNSSSTTAAKKVEDTSSELDISSSSIQKLWNSSIGVSHQWKGYNYTKWREENSEYDFLTQIGLSRLYVAPRNIHISTQPGNESQPNLRATSSIPGNLWRASRYITLEIDLPSKIDRTHPRWDDFPKDAHGNVLYDPVQELRKLFVQARVAPFLPIRWGSRDASSPSLPDIDALAIQQLVISTVPSVPDMYHVTIVAIEFDWSYYLKDPDKIRFEEYFVWPVFEKWIDVILEEQHAKYPAPPAGGLRITIPSEDALVAAKDAFASRVNASRHLTLNEQIQSLEDGLERLSNATSTDDAGSIRRLKEIGEPSSTTVEQVMANDPAASMVEVPTNLYFRESYVPDKRLMLFRIGSLSWALEDRNFKENLLRNLHVIVPHSNVFRESGTTGLAITKSPLLGDRIIESTLGSYYATSPENHLLSNEDIASSYLGWFNDPNDAPIGSSPNPDQCRSSIIIALKRLLDEKRQKRSLSEGMSATSRKEITEGVQNQNVLSRDELRENIVMPGTRIESVQLILTNFLSVQDSENSEYPVVQFWGSPSIEVTMLAGNKTGFEPLESAYSRARKFQIEYGPFVSDRAGLEPGHWAVHEQLLANLGLKWTMPSGLERGNIEQTPLGENGELKMRVYIPNPSLPLVAGDSGPYDPNDWLKLLRMPKFDRQRVTTDFAKVVLGEIEVEQRLKLIPLYPDLYLPTWDTLDKWLKDIKGVSVVRPANQGVFVDPDFFITSRDPWADPEMIGMQGVLDSVDQGKASVTLTSRFGETADLTIDSRKDADPPVADSATMSDYIQSMNGSTSTESVKPGEVNDITPVSNTSVVVTENPYMDPGILPLNEAVKGAFHDFTFGQPFNRLVAAYPTMLVLFYREGVWTGFKRMWDQFYGRLPIRYIKVDKEMDKPDDVATIGIGASISGIAGRDVTESPDLEKWIEKSHTADNINRAKAEHGQSNLAGVVASKFGEWADEAMNNKGYDYRSLQKYAQKWEDLSNVLVVSPGTRVHIRLGYGSNPAQIPQVFSGCIVEVNASEEGLDVIASGDGAELLGEIFLKKVTQQEESDKNEKEERSEWITMYPRKWLLDTLGSYNGGWWQRFKNRFGITGLYGSTLSKATYNVPVAAPGPVYTTNGVVTEEVTKFVYSDPDVDGVPIILLDNEYGIEHFGHPIPTNSNIENGTLTKSWLELGNYNFVNATEHAQNIFAPYRSRIQLFTNQTDIVDFTTATNQNDTQKLAEAILGNIATDYVSEESVKVSVYDPTPTDSPVDLSRGVTNEDLAALVFGVFHPSPLASMYGSASPYDTTEKRLAALKNATQRQRAEYVRRLLVIVPADKAREIVSSAVASWRGSGGGRDGVLSNALGPDSSLVNDSGELANVQQSLINYIGANSGDLSVNPKSYFNPFGESKIRLNVWSKGFFEIAKDLAKLQPGFIAAVHPFGSMRSTLFWGKPHYPLSFKYTMDDYNSTCERRRWLTNYDKRNNKSNQLNVRMAGEIIKTFSQCHMAHAKAGLLRNGIELNPAAAYNKAVVYWKDDTGDMRQTGRVATMPGVQCVTVQVDSDLYPENINETRIIVPFQYSFWARVGWPGAEDVAIAYSKSYAFEELSGYMRQMYAGHLILLGNGNIKPWDYVRVQDDQRIMTGLALVRRVTHHAEIGTGFVSDVVPGAVAWSTKSDNMRASVGVSVVSGQIAAAISMTDAVQKEAMLHRKLSISLLQQCIEVANTYASDRDIGNATQRVEFAKYEREFKRVLGAVKHGTSRQISVAMRQVVGAMEVKAGTTGPWSKTFSQKAVEGTVEKFCNRVLVPSVGKDNESFKSISTGLRRLQYMRAAVAGVTASIGAIVSPTGESAISLAQRNLEAAKEDAKNVMEHEVYREQAMRYRDQMQSFGDTATKTVEIAGKGIGLAGIIWALSGIASPVLACAGLLVLGYVMLLSTPKIAALYDSNEHSTVIMPLMRAGREYQAGLGGHRGCIVGEAGNALEEYLYGVRRNRAMQAFFNIR